MNEAQELADELAYWMFQAAWHRAVVIRLCGGSRAIEPSEAEVDDAQDELTAARPAWRR